MSRALVYSSAVLLALGTFWYLLAGSGSTDVGGMGSTPATTSEYEAITGFFMQDDPATGPDGFEYVGTSLTAGAVRSQERPSFRLRQKQKALPN